MKSTETAIPGGNVSVWGVIGHRWWKKKNHTVHERLMRLVSPSTHGQGGKFDRLGSIPRVPYQSFGASRKEFESRDQGNCQAPGEQQTDPECEGVPKQRRAACVGDYIAPQAGGVVWIPLQALAALVEAGRVVWLLMGIKCGYLSHQPQRRIPPH